MAVVRAHAVLVLASVAVALLVAAVYLHSAPRRYVAHAELLVSATAGDQPGLRDLNLVRTSPEAGSDVQTITWMATTNRVAAYASAALGGHPSASAMSPRWLSHR